MPKSVFALMLLLLFINSNLTSSDAASTYYVSSGQVFGAAITVPAAGVNNLATNINGSGLNRGSMTYPFLTIQYAAKQVHAGDTVIVRDGLYNENVYVGQNSGGTIVTSQSGTSNAPITFQAEHTGLAYVHGSATYDGCFHIKSAAQSDVGWANITNPIGYITISGFDLQSSGYDGKAFYLTWAHHITIRNCNIHDNGAAGIATAYSDYLLFDGNTVVNNCRTSSYNSSGISVWLIRPFDQITSAYHNIIRRNTCFNNYISAGALNIFKDTNGINQPIHHTDGNGIIIDTSYQNVSMLIDSNLVYNSGGRGIIDDGSPNVDIFNNTCYNNCIDTEVGGSEDILLLKVTWGTGPENAICQNVNIRDNISWPANGKRCINIDSTSLNVKATNNWLYSGSGYSGSGNGSTTLIKYTTLGGTWTISGNYGLGMTNTGGNPLFVNPGTSAIADFRLQSVSPCKDKSISQPSTDVDNSPRPYGAGYDLGAFEYHSDITVTRGGYRYQRSNGHVFQSITLTAGKNVTGPLSLVLDNLTGTSLVNLTGTTAATVPFGSPYVNTAGLTSGASEVLVLEFSGYPTSYTTRMFASSESR